jgi:2-oxoglutarate dehydrogenase complex dehydrogenase (E1) component-like enzyme
MEAAGFQIEKQKMLDFIGVGASPDYIQGVYTQFVKDGNTAANEVAQYFKPKPEEPKTEKPKRKYVRKPKTEIQEDIVIENLMSALKI